MKTCGLLLAFCFGASACGPKDVIPTAAHHPANPAAPVAAAPAVIADAGAPAVEPAPTPQPDAAVPATAAIAAAERTAYERAKPVLEKYCAGCHTSSGTKKAKKKALPHFSMDGYPFGGHHAEEIGANVREVLGATGEKPTMPADRPGAVKGDDLDAVLAWTKAFDAAHEAGLHGKATPEGHHH